ncbi:decreased expression in renal and prostate cancer protein-like, partial [Phyllostomus hastatus]|uniref:decreased expression in renal and prostate cancer protein-like n=1 Tax=Phyllostomus hastatus TaxID=9423 RepID=UPI001E67F1D5
CPNPNPSCNLNLRPNHSTNLSHSSSPNTHRNPKPNINSNTNPKPNPNPNPNHSSGTNLSPKPSTIRNPNPNTSLITNLNHNPNPHPSLKPNPSPTPYPTPDPKHNTNLKLNPKPNTNTSSSPIPNHNHNPSTSPVLKPSPSPSSSYNSNPNTNPKPTRNANPNTNTNPSANPKAYPNHNTNTKHKPNTSPKPNPKPSCSRNPNRNPNPSLNLHANSNPNHNPNPKPSHRGSPARSAELHLWARAECPARTQARFQGGRCKVGHGNRGSLGGRGGLRLWTLWHTGPRPRLWSRAAVATPAPGNRGSPASPRALCLLAGLAIGQLSGLAGNRAPVAVVSGLRAWSSRGRQAGSAGTQALVPGRSGNSGPGQPQKNRPPAVPTISREGRPKSTSRTGRVPGSGPGLPRQLWAGPGGTLFRLVSIRLHQPLWPGLRGSVQGSHGISVLGQPLKSSRPGDTPSPPPGARGRPADLPGSKFRSRLAAVTLGR